MKHEKQQKPVSENTQIDFDAYLLENEKWLTTEGAMEHLNVSRSTIYRWRKKRYLPSFKLGHIPIYPKHLVNKFFMRRALHNVKEQ
ncbi:helix-turn-helix domain-containing protein [Polaribacter sp.]|uniref:helix-turn-helix domain-containing protein n=1 Tax=Polaribacter sp. TaxID=1920175 RepID=UPI003EF256BF